MVKQLLRPNLLTAVYAACLFCVVLGLKWATFDRYGSAMPDWDQWDAEAYYTLIPWFEHDHFLRHLFTPHNEHRVVLTKLQNLALTVLNGQWDARLQAVTNAVLHSALATALWLLAVRQFRPASPSCASPPLPLSPSFLLPALWLLAVALFGFPLAWQNVLGGFHSQQYWLLATSFAAIVTLPFARPGTFPWWTGATAAVLALFTMGSGLLAPAVVIVVLAFRLLRRETSLRSAWPAFALSAALVAAGALTRVEVDYHAHMKAKTLHDFVFSLVHSLQWPVPAGRDGLAAVLWLPWFLAAWRVLRSRPDFSSPSASPPTRPPTAVTGQILVALGGWVLVQLLATAYARGAGAGFPASRYMDTLTFGTMVNGLCLAWLFCPILHPPSSLPPRLRLLPTTLAVAWSLTLAYGLHDLVTRNLADEMPSARRYYDHAEAHLRGYLATDDPAQLAFPDIPYPSAGGLIDRLDHPCIREVMPAVVRAPLPLTPAHSAGFPANRVSALAPLAAPRPGLSPATPPLPSTPTWGSFDPASGPAATGSWTGAPLTAPLGAWLKFETAGHLGESPATLALELRDARTHALLASVRPSKVPGDTWRAAYVRAPRDPFVVVARDEDATRWFAFSAPVEMGRLSYFAWRATRNGLFLAQLAAGLAASLALLVYRLRPPPPRPIARPLSPSPRLSASASPALPVSSLSSTRPLSRFSLCALALGLFLALWGAKLVAIDRYGSDLPYWDQWAKEGDHLLTPWFERHELWKNLFLPHNEHRIAPTLALNLALVAGGGQWDARVQCAASAALHAALATGLFLWALARLPRRWALAFGAVLLLSVAPPIAWENVLGGFQSQFYFLAGFTLLALGGLLATPALSPRWFGGLACALLALVSMGSGLLLAAPLAAVAALRLVSRTSPRRDALLTLGAALALGGLGAVLRTPTPWHDALHAKTAAEFLLYVARCLAWPLPPHPWLAPLLWAPWLTLLFLRLRSALSPQLPTLNSQLSALHASTSDFLLAAGAWVLLQIAAVSFSRAGGGGLPASRYGDIAALGLIVSFAALAVLASAHPARRRAFAALGATFFVLAAVCVAVATRGVLAGPLPDKKKESLAAERSVQAFVLTDDYATFAQSPLPFPLPDWLARILRRPDIRAVLPTSVRAPLRLEHFSTAPTPPAPDLWERRTHSLTTPGEWRSAPLPPATLAWWKIETTGPAFATVPVSSSPPLSLSLSSAASSASAIAPTRPPHPAEWRAAYVPAPRGPATLFARTDAPDRWLAFTEPVEMSALSYRTRQLAQHGAWLAAAGLALLAAASALALRRSGERHLP